MTYQQYDQSIEDGQPVEFFAFALGTNVFRYTNSAKNEMTPDGFVWQSAAISHDGFKQTGESATDATVITMPSELTPAMIFATSPPSGKMAVRILRKQRDDNETRVTYIGTVSQVNLDEPGKATVTCETLSASMQRSGLRLPWQRTCPYALYDPVTCGVDPEPLAVNVKILQVSGFWVRTDVAGSYPDGRFAGGFFRWNAAARGLEYRQIEAHVGFDLRLFGVINDLYVGQELQIFPGCARTVAACLSFDNLGRYGGVPNMPGRSPFDGNPVFY
jgi:uncharacterized phage protein (TIGR02218 family)